MTMLEFKTLVRSVMDALPDELRPFLDNVVVEVADWPTKEQLLSTDDFDEEDIEEGDSAFGLFEPLELPGDIEFTDMPHKLWIFKEPHEQEFPEPARLRTEIRKTVIHELAHHFGWSDRDLERFDANPDPFGGRPS